MSSETLKDGNKLTNTVKYLSTAAIFMECITYGCAANFYSPVLVDLKNRYSTDIESISKIFIAMMVGYLIGAFGGGLLFTRVINRQHGVVLAFSGIAASLFMTPYCPSVLLLFLNSGLLGFATGAYDTAQIVWMIEMWQSKAGPFIQAQHFCFALGSNLPILMVTPFLDKSEGVNILEEAHFINENMDMKDPLSEPSGLQIPFVMAGGLAIFNIIYELFLITCYKYEKPAAEIPVVDILSVENGPVVAKTEDERKSEGKSSKLYRIKLIIISGIFMGFCVGMELCSMQFIPTLAQYGDLRLSEAEGALILTGLTGAFTIGRAVGILVTFKVPPHVILVFNLLFVASGNAIILLWANSSYEMLWVGCIALGLGYSTMYASFYTFMAQHLVFTDQIGSIMLVCGSSVGVLYPLIVGRFIEQNPAVLTYTNFLSVCVSSIAFMVAYFVSTRHSKKSNLLKH